MIITYLLHRIGTQIFYGEIDKEYCEARLEITFKIKWYKTWSSFVKSTIMSNISNTSKYK